MSVGQCIHFLKKHLLRTYNVSRKMLHAWLVAHTEDLKKPRYRNVEKFDVFIMHLGKSVIYNN